MIAYHGKCKNIDPCRFHVKSIKQQWHGWDVILDYTFMRVYLFCWHEFRHFHGQRQEIDTSSIPCCIYWATRQGNSQNEIYAKYFRMVLTGLFRNLCSNFVWPSLNLILFVASLFLSPKPLIFHVFSQEVDWVFEVWKIAFPQSKLFFFFFHFLGKGSFEISGAAQRSFSHVALSSGVILLLLLPSRRKIADSTKNQKTRIKGSYYWNVLLEKSWLIIWLNYSFPDSAKQLSVRASCYIPLLHTQICLPMPTYYIKKFS